MKFHLAVFALICFISLSVICEGRAQINVSEEQRQYGEDYIESLSKLKDITSSCVFNDTIKNETCVLHVDETIVTGFIQRVKFDASVSVAVNLKVFSQT